MATVIVKGFPMHRSAPL